MLQCFTLVLTFSNVCGEYRKGEVVVGTGVCHIVQIGLDLTEWLRLELGFPLLRLQDRLPPMLAHSLVSVFLLLILFWVTFTWSRVS